MNSKIKDLFHRYETGEASKRERELVEAWFSRHDHSPIAFDDKDQHALSELDSRMDSLLAKPVQGAHVDRPIRRLTFLKYAAVWAGILLVGSLAYWQLKKTVWQDQVHYVVKTNHKGIPVRYQLPDSSLVYLGAGSKLTYPESFAADTRNISLQGAAFFKVKHDTHKPFIVVTDEIQTQVLGTSFKIDAFNEQSVAVAVATGKVGVTENIGKQKKQLAMLTPGLRVTWNRRKREAVVDKIDLYSLEQWQAGNMVFQDQTLAQVVPELERRFNVRIAFADPQVAAHKVSSTFTPNESAEDVMEILSTVGKFTYKADGKNAFKIYKTE